MLTFFVAFAATSAVSYGACSAVLSLILKLFQKCPFRVFLNLSIRWFSPTNCLFIFNIIPTYAQISSIILILNLFRHVSVLLYRNRNLILGVQVIYLTDSTGSVR
jgi:hypothetical protein